MDDQINLPGAATVEMLTEIIELIEIETMTDIVIPPPPVEAPRLPPDIEAEGGPKRTIKFFPQFLLRDLVGWLVALALLAALGARGAYRRARSRSSPALALALVLGNPFPAASARWSRLLLQISVVGLGVGGAFGGLAMGVAILYAGYLLADLISTRVVDKFGEIPLAPGIGHMRDTL